eukprot:1161922-Pelagomonas_calceolata.AAC.5
MALQASIAKDETPQEDQQMPQSPFLMGGQDAAESESGSAVEDPAALEAKLAWACMQLAFLRWVVEPGMHVLGDQPAPEELSAGDLAGGAGITTVQETWQAALGSPQHGVYVLGDQPAPEELSAGDLAGGAGITTACPRRAQSRSLGRRHSRHPSRQNQLSRPLRRCWDHARGQGQTSKPSVVSQAPKQMPLPRPGRTLCPLKPGCKGSGYKSARPKKGYSKRQPKKPLTRYRHLLQTRLHVPWLMALFLNSHTLKRGAFQGMSFTEAFRQCQAEERGAPNEADIASTQKGSTQQAASSSSGFKDYIRPGRISVLELNTLKVESVQSNLKGSRQAYDCATLSQADLMSRLTNDPEEEAWLAYIGSVAAMDDFEHTRHMQSQEDGQCAGF